MFTAVCTDTRALQSGCLFIAIKGDNFDAHSFIPEAAAQGAAAAIVHDIPNELPTNLPLIKVADTRRALGDLAARARESLLCKVVAVAGSNGKTSTKYLVDSVLGSVLRGTMSPKSFNNDIGVPLTILPADIEQDYLVLEVGTNHPGEVARLADIAKPDIAVITNCGAEHLEFLKDLEGVRAENASIVSGLRANGTMIVNGDDRALADLVRDGKRRIVTFGFGRTNDLRATEIECDATGTRFRFNDSRELIFVNALGKHAALNALATIGVARELGLADEQIFKALATSRSPDMRLQLSDAGGGVTLLNDAYNANPNSMRAAIETLMDLPSRGRKIAVLGDMRELGETSERHHCEIGQLVSTCKFDLLACVGRDGAVIAQAAVAAGIDLARVRQFEDSREAAAVVPQLLIPGDLILLKASRGVGLEVVARAIVESRRQSSHA